MSALQAGHYSDCCYSPCLVLIFIFIRSQNPFDSKYVLCGFPWQLHQRKTLEQTKPKFSPAVSNSEKLMLEAFWLCNLQIWKAVLGLKLVAFDFFCHIRHLLSTVVKWPRLQVSWIPCLYQSADKYWSGVRKFFGRSLVFSSLRVLLCNSHFRNTGNNNNKKKKTMILSCLCSVFPVLHYKYL